ncbi:hypothetical protein H4218_001290 [Coemansia sp. IMI 209128]|nr:hypothetical protein GGI10_002760 [Coemansia sp. RSA 2530]KAJ2701690.1 hypothetical protein H4218_001290 [Coemansia sp. IMI 209128]
MDAQRSSTTVLDQRPLPSIAPAHSANSSGAEESQRQLSQHHRPQHYRSHTHGHGHSSTAPMFYHIHQASGPPPPSRYYTEGSNHAVAMPESSTADETRSTLPPLQLLERPVKGKRKRANAQQLDVLNKVFSTTSFPSTELRTRLARDLGMTPRTVQIWFQNKRQASRQRDGHHSRNTKSMAAHPFYNRVPAHTVPHRPNPHSLSPPRLSAHTTLPSRVPAHRSASPESSLMHSISPSVSPSQSPLVAYSQTTRANQPRIATSSQELMALVVAASEAAPAPARAETTATASTPTTSGAKPASPAWSDDSGTAVGKKTHTSHDGDKCSSMGLTVAAATAVMEGSRQRCDNDVGPYSKSHHQDPRGATGSNRYAHTRNDQWFTDNTPSKLDYLFGHNSQVVVMSARAHPPALGRAIHAPWDRSQPPSDRMNLPPLRNSDSSSSSRGKDHIYQSQTHQQSPTYTLPPMSLEPQSAGDASAVHRSMSLMDVLNAPPEQRKLPPLPPM